MLIEFYTFFFQLEDVKFEEFEEIPKFAAAVEKEPIRFSMQEGVVENICSSNEEPIWVLNFKKAIISHFQNSMNDIETSEVIHKNFCHFEYFFMICL